MTAIPITLSDDSGTTVPCSCGQDAPAYWTRTITEDRDDKHLVVDHHDDPSTGRTCTGAFRTI